MQTLLKAVEAQPDSGPEKYMALAQLCQGQEALQYFQRAIGIVNESHVPLYFLFLGFSIY